MRAVPAQLLCYEAEPVPKHPDSTPLDELAAKFHFLIAELGALQSAARHLFEAADWTIALEKYYEAAQGARQDVSHHDSGVV